MKQKVMQARHSNMKLYFEELATTSRKFYIPYFKQFLSIPLPSTKILEIGCRDGGNLVPFAEIGCHVKGVDISEYFIKHAIEFFSLKNLSATFEVSDIFKVTQWNEKFDIIIVADVIEHLTMKKELLEFVKNHLSEKGIVFFKFPAWQMPFGGHQQLCKSKFLSHLPYYHLLPKCIYKSIFKLLHEPQHIIDELLDIKSCKISIEKFERLSKKENFIIKDRKLYFINPHYETKFKLKPRILYSLLGKTPYIRNFFTTSCFYVLSVK